MEQLLDRGLKEARALSAGQRKYAVLKSTADWALSAAALVVLSPLFLGIVLAILLEDGRPVFFRQRRIGKDKRCFNIYKFRTMRADTPRDTPTHLLESPERYITRVGRFLRRTSLDELPQLLNCIRLELVWIGPRPALWNQDDLIALRDAWGVHQVKPGITGWAQVHGRDEIEIEEKARLDAYYVQHFGPAIDFKTLLRTAGAVAKAEGNHEGGTGAMKKAGAKENTR